MFDRINKWELKAIGCYMALSYEYDEFAECFEQEYLSKMSRAEKYEFLADVFNEYMSANSSDTELNNQICLYILTVTDYKFVTRK